MKSALLTKLKAQTGLRPLTAEEALLRWYEQGIDTDARLTAKAHLLLGWLCILASGEDGGPLWYEVRDMRRKFKWSDAETRQAAENAAAAGFIEYNGRTMILVDPRARKAAS